MPMVVERALAMRLYLGAFCLFIVWGSVTTLWSAADGHHAHVDRAFSLLLATGECVAAVGFLMRRSRRLCGWLLVGIFVLASLVTLHDGGFPAQLLFDLCTTLFLLNGARA
jgi:hypothetical protein